jgi:hypothetical protein
LQSGRRIGRATAGHGEVIASQVLMYCGDTAYTWKTRLTGLREVLAGRAAGRQDHRRASGKRKHQGHQFCAAESSFMGQLWSRRAMADMLVDIGPGKIARLRIEALRLTAISAYAICATGSQWPGVAEQAEAGSLNYYITVI